MGEISSHGSHSLPKGLPSGSKVVGTADIMQMPHRSLKNTVEQSQRHAESDHWFNEANQHVTSQLDGLGGKSIEMKFPVPSTNGPNR